MKPGLYAPEQVVAEWDREAYQRRRSIRARQRRAAFVSGALAALVVSSAAWLLVSYRGAVLLNHVLEAVGL